MFKNSLHQIAILFVLIGCYTIGCTLNSDSNTGSGYMTKVDYENNSIGRKRTSKYISNKGLYLFFEQGFLKDTIDISINNEPYSSRLYMTTEEYLSLATMVEFQNIDQIETVEIRKNKGRVLQIILDDKRMNIWGINYWSDTLRAYWYKYPPVYE